jgi:hypothetical protein
MPAKSIVSGKGLVIESLLPASPREGVLVEHAGKKNKPEPCSLFVPYAAFSAAMRFSLDHLRAKALVALEEALEESRLAPVRRSWALRFSLAFLSNFSTERDPFDDYWAALVEPKQPPRYASVNVALNRIYRAVGVERDHAFSLRFRQL